MFPFTYAEACIIDAGLKEADWEKYKLKKK
jgi:hypothetical protein